MFEDTLEPFLHWGSFHSFHLSGHLHTNWYLYGDGVCVWWRAFWLHSEAWQAEGRGNPSKFLSCDLWFISGCPQVLSTDHLGGWLLPPTQCGAQVTPPQILIIISIHTNHQGSQTRKSFAWHKPQCQDCWFWSLQYDAGAVEIIHLGKASLVSIDTLKWALPVYPWPPF